MANKYCGSCGNGMSEADQFCPSCGKPASQVAQIDTSDSNVNVPPLTQQTGRYSQTRSESRSIWKRPLFLVPVGCFGLLAIFFFLAIIGAALSGGSSTDTAGNGDSSASGNNEQQAIPQDSAGSDSSATEEPSDETPVYSLGENVRVGDSVYTVTNAQIVTELPDPYGIDGPLTGNFVLVDFTVANEGSEPASVSDLGLYLYDGQENQYETDSEAMFYLPDDTSLFLLDRINPGLSRDVQVLYSVPPGTSEFELEVASGFFAAETARIDLGI